MWCIHLLILKPDSTAAMATAMVAARRGVVHMAAVTVWDPGLRRAVSTVRV